MSTTTVPWGVPVQTFSGNHGGLKFSHPRAWRETHDASLSADLLLVYLSNTRLHPACAMDRVKCLRPLAKLHPGDVLVFWNSKVDYPGTGPGVPHPNTAVGGRPADVEVSRPGDSLCAGLNQDETVTAEIARPGGNHYEMVACLRGPNLARNETLVREMLNSTNVTR